MEYRQFPEQVWSAFELHPTLHRMMVSLGAAGLEGVLEARKIHTVPNYRRYEFLLLRARLRRSVHVNLKGEAPGVMTACLYDFIANLPSPVIRNERDWTHIYTYEFNPMFQRPSLYYLQQMYLKALLYLKRQERLLVVSLVFMVRQQVDTELRRGKLDLHEIDYLLKLTIFYYLKAMHWTNSLSNRGRLCRVFINLVRNMWLLEPAFAMQVDEHEALTGCIGPDQVAWKTVMTSQLQHYNMHKVGRRWDFKEQDRESEDKKYWNLNDVLPLDYTGILGYLPHCICMRFFRCVRGSKKIPEPITKRIKKYV